MIDNFDRLHVHQTVIQGEIVAENGQSRLLHEHAQIVNQFTTTPKRPQGFFIPYKNQAINIIDVIDGQLITKRSQETLEPTNGNLTSNIEKDILKIVVVNRYEDRKPGCGVCQKFRVEARRHCRLHCP